jgi:hypothetical protein
MAIERKLDKQGKNLNWWEMEVTNLQILTLGWCERNLDVILAEIWKWAMV